MLTTLPFSVEQTHGIVIRPGMRDRISSDDNAWKALYASAQTESPFEGHFGAVKDQLLVLHRSGPVTLDRFDSGRPRACRVSRGGVHLYPGGLPFSLRLYDVLDTLHVYLRRAVIEEVASDFVAGDPSRVEIPATIAEDDETLQSLLRAVHVSLEFKDRATALYIDHLARAVAIHLVHRYSGARIRDLGAEAIPADLARAIDYMRAHIDEPITLDDLARAVGRSASHLGRQFRQQLGMAPHAYLIDMRLDLARDMLGRTSERIAVIAAACGFSHQEHMTRLFRRRFKTTPGQWRRAHRH